QGDGRFGVLEIFKHVAPGLVIDIGEPLVRRWPPWALGYCVLGFFAAIARTATEFVVVLLLGARAENYLFPAGKLVPNLTAGGLRGFVSVVVLRVVADSGSKASSESAVPPDGNEVGQRPSSEQHHPGDGNTALVGKGSSPRHGRDDGRRQRPGH